jgi:hypothetical protein
MANNSVLRARAKNGHTLACDKGFGKAKDFKENSASALGELSLQLRAWKGRNSMHKLIHK